jgi:hypothetical protein
VSSSVRGDFRSLYGDVAADALEGRSPVHLYRVEVPSLYAERRREALPEDVPHGMYFSIVPSEQATSGWAGSVRATGLPWTERRARLAVGLDDSRVLHVQPAEWASDESQHEDAGASALKQLCPEFFDMAMDLARQGDWRLAPFLQVAYPELDWSNYPTSGHMLMAAGALAARNRGYKALVGAAMAWHGIREPEVVALTNDAVVLTTTLCRDEELR